MLTTAWWSHPRRSAAASCSCCCTPRARRAAAARHHGASVLAGAAALMQAVNLAIVRRVRRAQHQLRARVDRTEVRDDLVDVPLEAADLPPHRVDRCPFCFGALEGLYIPE